MKKKDLYEHLANIYLDASSPKKKKTRPRPDITQSIFLVSILVVGAVLISTHLSRNRGLNSDTALVLCFEPVKINFHFDPAKKEIYSVNLNKLDLSKFKTLAFAVKKTNYHDDISLRIEFTNTFKEKSEVYAERISHKWQDYKINFSEFKKINAWFEMSDLSFIVEEWNTREKRGLVYLDNVRFLH